MWENRKDALSDREHFRLRIRAKNGRWRQQREPKTLLNSLFPPVVQDILFHFSNEHLAELLCPSSRVLNIRGFRAWMLRRLGEVRFSQCPESRADAVLRASLSGQEFSEALGIVHLAALRLTAFFRQWILTAEEVCSELKHLRGKALPWILDSPFSFLDVATGLEAAKLLAAVKTQLVIATSPVDLQSPVDLEVTSQIGARIWLTRDIPHRLRS